MSAAFCPDCGTARPADAAFCPNCAYRFAAAASSEAATVRAPEGGSPAVPADPDATVRVDPDATVRVAPEAAPSTPPPPVPTSPPVASGDETILVPPEPLAASVPPIVPVPPLSATPPMSREERRARRRQRQAGGTAPTTPIAPIAPLATTPIETIPIEPVSSTTPIEPLEPSRQRPQWDVPAMPRAGGMPKAARFSLIGLGGVLGLIVLLALALVLGTGTIEANAAPWLQQQAAAIPGEVAYDGIEAHPIRGHMTLVGVRYSERGTPTVGESELTAERVEIDVPRAFFFAALAGRLPDLQSGAPVEEIDMTAHDITGYNFDGSEVVMQAEQVSVDFNGLFAPDLYEAGFDVASNQRGRLVVRGLTSPEASRDAPVGTPTAIDEMVFDARWDAGSGEFEIREATFEAGEIRASGDGRLTVAPTILARLQVGDLRGAEDLIDSGIVPVTSFEYAAEVSSDGALSFPIDDEATFEIGSFSMSADAEGTLGGENATLQTVDIQTEGAWKGEIEGVRLVLYPETAARFNANQGAQLGITAAMLAEPASASMEVRVDDNRVSIRDAEMESGLGRAQASGALQIDPRDPESAFFAEPFELRLDRLPGPFASQLSSLFNESSFPGLSRDGDAFLVRLEGRLDELAGQF